MDYNGMREIVLRSAVARRIGNRWYGDLRKSNE